MHLNEIFKLVSFLLEPQTLSAAVPPAMLAGIFRNTDLNVGVFLLAERKEFQHGR
jgi:hypothetical protein